MVVEMPRSTYAYPFEDKILAMAKSQPIDPDGTSGITYLQIYYLYAEDPWDDPNVCVAHTKPKGGSWPEFMDELERSSTPYVFYDPDDASGYVYLRWSNMKQQDFERECQVVFDQTDFQPLGSMPTKPSLSQFPDSWSVMF